MRPIDADDVIERLDMICDAGGCLSPVTKAVRSFCKGLINNQPTIETEPDKGWISVKDRLPPYVERVLVVNEAYETKRGYTKYNCGVTIREPHLDFTFWGHKVTHWQHLPESPKGE